MLHSYAFARLSPVKPRLYVTYSQLFTLFFTVASLVSFCAPVSFKSPDIVLGDSLVSQAFILDQRIMFQKIQATSSGRVLNNKHPQAWQWKQHFLLLLSLQYGISRLFLLVLYEWIASRLTKVSLLLRTQSKLFIYCSQDVSTLSILNKDWQCFLL